MKVSTITSLVKFLTEATVAIVRSDYGGTDAELTVETHPLSRTIMLQFHIVKFMSKYNVILRRTSTQKLSMKVSTITSLVKFLTEATVVIVRSDYGGTDAILAAVVEEGNIQEIMWEPIPGDTPKN
nr:reverse transcriptase domain-containing protein [Tanacetum cinerariifolium]